MVQKRLSIKGVITNSCVGKLTANVFFGKAGVGKSTVASWMSTVPGLFEVGTISGGTTTLGTWLSSSISTSNYCEFSQEKFQPRISLLFFQPSQAFFGQTYSDSEYLDCIILKYFKITFQPLLDITSIPPLPDMNFCLNSTGNFAFFDTEGLDYQTELGEHYDIVTVLPHTLIAENVFLVLRDRLNPNEDLVPKILI